jgi:hypothetical protein
MHRNSRELLSTQQWKRIFDWYHTYNREQCPNAIPPGSIGFKDTEFVMNPLLWKIEGKVTNLRDQVNFIRRAPIELCGLGAQYGIYPA